MKKIILLTFVLTVIAGTALFANGEQEGSFDDAVRPWRGGEYDGEILSLNGTLKLEPGELPELVAGGEEYELMYPHFLDDGIDLSDGESVTVEGFLVPGPRWDSDGEELHLRVTKAVIDGEEYDLEEYGFGPMMGGRFGGPMPGGRYDDRRGYGNRPCPGCPNWGEGAYGGGRRGGMMGGGRFHGPGMMGGRWGGPGGGYGGRGGMPGGRRGW